MLTLSALLAFAMMTLPKSDKITVASYYFGDYHPGDPRIERWKGKGWSEWEDRKSVV